ncbi:MAG: type II secretion system protein [Anaerohalosphaeraceae bacterium]
MKRARKGFTLVEILIVVVILGILAAIVIPQFSQASTDSKKSSLQSNLQTIRSQIALYKIQHNDTTPSDVDATFKSQMMEFTALDGTFVVDGAKDATYSFGPYLQVGVPVNPFTNGNVLGTDWLYTTDGETWEFTAGDGGGLVTGALWTEISAY